MPPSSASQDKFRIYRNSRYSEQLKPVSWVPLWVRSSTTCTRLAGDDVLEDVRRDGTGLHVGKRCRSNGRPRRRAGRSPWPQFCAARSATAAVEPSSRLKARPDVAQSVRMPHIPAPAPQQRRPQSSQQHAEHRRPVTTKSGAAAGNT